MQAPPHLAATERGSEVQGGGVGGLRAVLRLPERGRQGRLRLTSHQGRLPRV